MEISEFMIEIIITINTFLAGFVLTSLNGRHRSEDDDLTERESTQILWESLSFSVLMSNVILSFFVSNVSPVFSIHTKIKKESIFKMITVSTLFGITLVFISIINSVFIYFDNDNDHKISDLGYLSIFVFFIPVLLTFISLSYIHWQAIISNKYIILLFCDLFSKTRTIHKDDDESAKTRPIQKNRIINID